MSNENENVNDINASVQANETQDDELKVKSRGVNAVKNRMNQAQTFLHRLLERNVARNLVLGRTSSALIPFD
jgi:hypothetical protein